MPLFLYFHMIKQAIIKVTNETETQHLSKYLTRKLLLAHHKIGFQ
jgi:hypothetical protein